MLQGHMHERRESEAGARLPKHLLERIAIDTLHVFGWEPHRNQARSNVCLKAHAQGKSLVRETAFTCAKEIARGAVTRSRSKPFFWYLRFFLETALRTKLLMVVPRFYTHSLQERTNFRPICPTPLIAVLRPMASERVASIASGAEPFDVCLPVACSACRQRAVLFLPPTSPSQERSARSLCTLSLACLYCH